MRLDVRDPARATDGWGGSTTRCGATCSSARTASKEIIFWDAAVDSTVR